MPREGGASSTLGAMGLCPNRNHVDTGSPAFAGDDILFDAIVPEQILSERAFEVSKETFMLSAELGLMIVYRLLALFVAGMMMVWCGVSATGARSFLPRWYSCRSSCARQG